jgi:hypothetical protein
MDSELGELDPNWFDMCSLTSQYNVRLLTEWHGGRILLKAALSRLLKRMFGGAKEFKPAVAYHGLLVFDREGLNGGGLWHAQDFSRALVDLGIGKCERIFDFCAGPGYIGYYLFACGYCQSLAMSDINPGATEAARHTAHYNEIENAVAIYTSDVLDQIPTTEKWDLVVANAPVVPSTDVDANNIIDYDVSGTLHRRFYGSVKQFMRPGGLILTLNTRIHSSPGYFRPMIEAGGGQIVGSLIRRDFRGRESDRYYLLSSW